MSFFNRALVVTAACIVVAGCSGAKDQDVLSSSYGSSTSTSGGTGGSAGSGATGSGGTKQPGTSSGATGSGVSTADCVEETEPNDDPSSPNELTTSLCGTLAPSSEVDYVEFDVPADARSMALTYQGNIRMRVTVGSQHVDISQSSNQSVPFVAGETYLVEIRANTKQDANIDYRINLQLE